MSADDSVLFGGFPVPKWWVVASLEMGQSEIPGEPSNERITEYLRTCFFYVQPDEEAWCSAFVHWCLEQCNIFGPRHTEYPDLGNPAARSWKYWGVPTVERLGAIVVLSRPGADWMGHVGFFVRATDSNILVYGGNQSNSVSYKWYSRERLLACRWPETAIDGNL